MTKFRKGDKASKREIRSALMILAAEHTPNRFNVVFQSDGSGPCAVLMVERDAGDDSDGISPFVGWPEKPAKFMGWRTIYMHVPYSYIEVFYDANGNYKATPEA